MSTQAPAAGSPSALAWKAGRGWPTLALAVCALAPIAIMGLLSSRWSYRLQPLIPFEAGNFEAMRRMLRSLFDPSARADDSWLPMERALAVLHGPHAGTLYETLFFSDQMRFQYPPSSLLWLELLSTLGLSGARALNAVNTAVLALDAASLGAIAWLLFRAAGRRGAAGPSPLGMGLLAAAATFCFYPVVRAQAIGQIQLWIDLLFSGAVLLWLLERRLLAGALIGLACTIKPQLGLLLLWALLWRERAFAAGVLAVLVPALAVSVARYGLHDHLAYLQVLGFLSRHGESFFTNHSVNGVLNAYLSGADPMRWRSDVFAPFHPVVYAGTVAASVAALALVAVPPLLHRRRRADLADLGTAAICAVIGSPVAWEHHYGILLPLFLVAARAVWAEPGGSRRAALAATLLLAWALVADLIPFTALLARSPLALLQAYCLFGALALLGVLLAVRPGLRPAAAKGA